MEESTSTQLALDELQRVLALYLAIRLMTAGVRSAQQ